MVLTLCSHTHTNSLLSPVQCVASMVDGRVDPESANLARAIANTIFVQMFRCPLGADEPPGHCRANAFY